MFAARDGDHREPPRASPRTNVLKGADAVNVFKEAEAGEGTRKPLRPSLLRLVKALTQETKTLIRQELKLAKTELSEEVSETARHGASVGIGGRWPMLG